MWRFAAPLQRRSGRRPPRRTNSGISPYAATNRTRAPSARSRARRLRTGADTTYLPQMIGCLSRPTSRCDEVRVDASGQGDLDASDLWSSGAHGGGQLAYLDAVTLLDHSSAKNTGKAITCDESGTVDIHLHDRDVAEVRCEQCRRGRSSDGPCDPPSGEPRPDLH